MKKIFAFLLTLPVLGIAQVKVAALPNKTSNYLQGDNIIIDDSVGTSGSTKKISIRNLKTNYSFGGAGISGLTTNYIPYATSSTTLGDGYLSQSGNYLKIADGKFITGPTTSKGAITFGQVGNEYVGLSSDGGAELQSFFILGSAGSSWRVPTSKISLTTAGIKLYTSSSLIQRWTINDTSFTPFANNSYNIGTSALGIRDIFVNRNVNLSNQTASTVLSLDAGNNITSVANGTGYLYNNGSGALSYSTPSAGTVTSVASADGSITVTNPTTTVDLAVVKAPIWTTGRTLAITGDLAYTSPSINGSGNVTATGTLATVNSNVGSFTNASVTVNGKGLITAASSGAAPVTTVTGTSPIVSSGGATPAISIGNAAADGSTKGAASFTANDFDATSGNISIDYTNGQAASGSNKGFLTSSDWTTFNNKGSGTVTSVSGTANQIASTGGATPVLSLVSGAILPGAPTIVSPGNSTQNIITTDATQTLSNKTFAAPALGTPASGVATNLTGTASGLTAGTVTDIGNLTGDVTSSNRATTLATVNSNVGSFTNGSFTVNGKGLITAASSGSAPEVPLTFSTGLTRTTNTITNNLSVGVSGGQTIIGGTAVGDGLVYKSTTGNGTLTAVAHGFSGGNNGATSLMNILNNGNVGFGVSPTAKMHIIAAAGNSGGILLDLGANSGTAALSYASIDFNVPTTGVTGQFFATASNYNGSNSLAANSIGLAAEATSGQLWLAAIGTSGTIDLVTGGSAVANKRFSLSSKGAVTFAQSANTTGAVTGFSYTAPANTGQTTGSEINGILWTTTSRQWAGSTTVALQREFYITSPTYTSASATKTITDAYTFYADAGPIASTNTSITRSWSGAFNGRVGVATNLYVGGLTTAATALIHLAAGTATASTAPLKFTTGTSLTSEEAGAMEYDGTDIYFTPSTVRHKVERCLTGSATLNFGSAAAGTSTDLTLTVTGAADGDPVGLGVPNGSTLSNGCFTAWVSATNTVTVRFTNNSLVSSLDPASGTFKATVNKN